MKCADITEGVPADIRGGDYRPAFVHRMDVGLDREPDASAPRASTPGTFIVPPTKAEEMYLPETFGRSGSDRVIVE